MLEVGQYLNINNNRGLICFAYTINETNYICVSFEDELYRFYSVKQTADGYTFKSITDKNIISLLMTKMADEELAGE
jgi:hypothetical protein